jgi:hypothetical protein
VDGFFCCWVKGIELEKGVVTARGEEKLDYDRIRL